jgi:nitroimidazol reductase NimA-like FMN-containing flavoprotein (pyridoxamine 5'-phosphate oxidase superfamily)
MLIKVMSAEECYGMLARTGFGRLGCAQNNQPYIVPVYFAYQAERIYGFSLSGQKIDWLRKNPRACVESDDIKSQYEWTSVIAMGTYEELSGNSEREASERSRVEQLLKERYMWWQTACEIFLDRKGLGSPGPFIFYCIHIEQISGLSASPEPAESIAPL